MPHVDIELENNKQFISNIPRTTNLLDCALIGACAVIRLNTVCCGYSLEAPRHAEAFLMITHKICFSGEVRTISVHFGRK